MSATSLMIRCIAMIAGIYMADVIGSEGIGLYRLTVSIYFFFASAVSSGFSLTVTRLTADYLSMGKRSAAKYAVEKCMMISFLFGAAAGGLMFVSSDFLGTAFLGDPRAVPSLRLLSVSLPFMAFSASVRGYFTAQRKTLQSSGEQLLEQITEILVLVMIMSFGNCNDLSSACMAAVTGTVAAEIVSFIYAFLLYTADIRKWNIQKEPVRKLYQKIIPIAAPISLNSCLRSGLSAVENVLIPFGLKRYGSDPALALSQYGIMSGMTMPVLTFPSVFIIPFAVLIVPEIAEARIKKYKNGIRHMTEKMINVTLLYSIPVTVILIFFAVPICQILYGNSPAGEFLMMLAPVIPFMYLDSVVDGMLKGLNKQTSYLVFNLIDSIIRVILTYILVPIYGIKGVVGVIIISELLNTTMSLLKLISVTKVKIRLFSSVVYPIICISLPCLLCNMIPPLHHLTVDTILKIIFCLMFYLFAVGAVKQKRNTAASKTVKCPNQNMS